MLDDVQQKILCRMPSSKNILCQTMSSKMSISIPDSFCMCLFCQLSNSPVGLFLQSKLLLKEPRHTATVVMEREREKDGEEKKERERKRERVPVLHVRERCFVFVL